MQEQAAFAPFADRDRVSARRWRGPCVLYCCSPPYTISPDGSGETILAHGGPTVNDSVDWFDWSPDSSKLVFQRNGSSNLIDASGGGETFLTTGATRAWQPVGLSALKNAR